MQNLDVLIVGGGPTGMTLALELAMQGISFRIIDKEPGRSDTSRAIVIQPRTLELLNRHGIARDLISLGTIGVGARLFVSKKFVADVDLNDLGFDDTAFPLPLFISQADTEKFLDEALLRYDRRVERPFAAEKVEQDGSGVTALLRGPGKAVEEVRCKYVVGCDGAHSIVRHAGNLTFEGAPYPQDFILADLHVSWDQPVDRLLIFFGQGLLVGFPMKDGVWRLVSSRPGGLAEHEEPTLSDFNEIFSKMAPGGAELSDPIWITRFRLHHRGANNYRAGRLFVAGDAAHIHSPVGGQGMNTGIQDAVNLGWKLGRVIRGEEDDSLLDSYDIERRRIGEHLLETTDRAFQIVSSANPLFIFFRNLLVPWVFPWAVKERSRRARMFRFMSELGIRYRNSPVVATSADYRGPLHGGDRAPDGDLQGPHGPTKLLDLCVGPTYHLMLFTGSKCVGLDEGSLIDIAARSLGTLSDAAMVHRIVVVASNDKSAHLDEEARLHGRYGFSEPGYVLVRPDGYIADIGSLNRKAGLGIEENLR